MRGCPECDAYLARAGWSLVGALASVGIERGKSTAQMADEHLAVVHAGHKVRS